MIILKKKSQREHLSISNENCTASETSLPKESIDMKACNNQGVSVLKPYYFVFRSSLILFTNRTSLELKSLLSPYFFVKHLGFQIGGAAYLQVWFIHGLLQYKQDKSIGLHFQITFGLFFKVSPGAHLFI